MAIRVYPGATNPSHHISLSDGVQTWGLRLDGGEDALRETPLTPSTLSFRDGLSSFGEWEPGLASIEQRSWHGGRGLEVFSADDPASAIRFYDSRSAWTQTPGMVMPAPQWYLAEGVRQCIQDLPGDMYWEGLFAEKHLLSRRFTVGSSDFPAHNVSIWMRRVGSPGPLSVSLAGDNSGEPGSTMPGVGSSITVKDVPDVLSEFIYFELSGLGSDLSAETTYHLVLSGGETDNGANHWEIGAGLAESESYFSSDGETWENNQRAVYFRIADEELNRSFQFFEFQHALYAVDKRVNGAPSHLYLNGTRGVATAGGPITLQDDDQTWPVDHWVDSEVRIISGTGKSQSRKIKNNTANALTVETWDIEPDEDSEYVIQASPHWTDISPVSGDLINGVVTDVAVLHDQAYLAQGDGQPILKLRFNSESSPPAHEIDDDGSNTADLLHSFHHVEDGPQLWRARTASCEVSRASYEDWGTNMTYGTEVHVGNEGDAILGLFDMGGVQWILKEDGLWRFNDSDEVQGFRLGLPKPRLPHGGIALHNGELFFAWGAGIKRYSGGSVDELGPSAENGLPSDRSGTISEMTTIGENLIASVNAGSEGLSSVLLWNGLGWHEVYRAPKKGMQIRALHSERCSSSPDRLWIDVGGDLVWLWWPSQVSKPEPEGEIAYQHEATIQGGAIDMGAMRLPKFLKELSLLSSSLETGAEIHLDYQLDGEIGGATWRTAGVFYSSPLDSVDFNLGQIRSIRIRLRLRTEKTTFPPVISGTILEGFARTPLKYQWSMQVKLGDLQLEPTGGFQADPDTFMQWLKTAAKEASKVRMRSIWRSLDNLFVIVEPPNLRRAFTNSSKDWWGGSVLVTLREV